MDGREQVGGTGTHDLGLDLQHNVLYYDRFPFCLGNLDREPPRLVATAKSYDRQALGVFYHFSIVVELL